MTGSAATRRRNPRGQGRRLRQEIVHAALRLVDARGAEALTLRAIAREANISAPSIYDHFEDLDQILAAAVGECFVELTGDVVAARDAADGPVRQLEAGCRAYLEFGRRRPERYSLLFRRDRPAGMREEEKSAASGAFQTLVDGIEACAAAGRSSSTNAYGDAVALWSALHGFATLRSTQSGFPWPEDDATIRGLIYGLGRITDQPS